MKSSAIRRRIVFAVLFGVVIVQIRLATGYIVVRPGPIAVVADVVAVDFPRGHGRNLLLASVLAKRANVLDFIQSIVDPSMDLQPVRNHVPEDLRWSQYADMLWGMMDESQQIAAAVALRHLGMRVEVNQDGDKIDIVFPETIHFEPNEFGGASAGLPFALEVYDQLSPGTLAMPYLVAATGDLRLDGSLQTVEGVRQKVIASERAGADIFLVPRENLQEAVSTARHMRVIGIDTFEEAVRILERLGETSKTP